MSWMWLRASAFVTLTLGAGAGAAAAQPVAAAPVEESREASAAVDPDSDSDVAASTPREEREPRRWETPVRDVPRNVVSVPLFALLHRGFSVTYERALPKRFSLVGHLGFVFPASGDYSSRRSSFGVEARYYAIPRGPFTRFEGDAPVGMFLATRVGLTHIAVYEQAGRKVGTLDRLALGAYLGYRFTIRGRVEFTPTLGALFYGDFHRHLPPTLRPTLSYGLTVGALFNRRRRPSSAPSAPASPPT